MKILLLIQAFSFVVFQGSAPAQQSSYVEGPPHAYAEAPAQTDGVESLFREGRLTFDQLLALKGVNSATRAIEAPTNQALPPQPASGPSWGSPVTPYQTLASPAADTPPPATDAYGRLQGLLVELGVLIITLLIAELRVRWGLAKAEEKVTEAKKEAKEEIAAAKTQVHAERDVDRDARYRKAVLGTVIPNQTTS